MKLQEFVSQALIDIIKGIQEAKKKTEETIQIEKKHDRLREDLVKRIVSKETMVFSRTDRLMLVEEMDSIVDDTEIVVRKLMQHSTTILPEFVDELKEMSVGIGKIGTEVKNLIHTILVDFSKGDEFIEKITDLRREVREKHWDLLNLNFKLKPDYLDFIYYQNLIECLYKVADESEEFADEIHGLLCKYAL